MLPTNIDTKYVKTRKYGADSQGFEVTSLEALRRAQSFRLGAPRGPEEDASQPAGDFTLAEYMDAFMENAVRNIGRY
jgi:hypothetical protein